MFKRLSHDKTEQHEFYRLLFAKAISQGDLNEIRLGCTSGMPIGSSRFKKTAETAAGRKIGHLSKGRPLSSLE